MSGLRISVALVLAVFARFDVSALNLSLTTADIERALSLGRRSSADPDRARFHGRYVIPVHGAKLNYITVERIEIITEFRRLVLIAEQHAALNDSFGRAGLRDVQEALRPWRGRLSIVAFLKFDRANRVIPVLPPVAILVDENDVIEPIDSRAAALPGAGTPPGERLEAIFDATSIGQTTRLAIVRYDNRVLARVRIDFRALE